MRELIDDPQSQIGKRTQLAGLGRGQVVAPTSHPPESDCRDRCARRRADGARNRPSQVTQEEQAADKIDPLPCA